jgi:RNA polymerase sigma factor (sigma-70 family)
MHGWDAAAPHGLAGARSVDPVTSDDVDLLRCVAAGDRQALTDLYVRYRQPLYHYLLRLAGDPGLAEDLLQETFVAVWRSAGSFAGRSAVQTWLVGVARRQAHNVLRRRSLPLAGEAELAVVESPERSPEEEALAGAARAELLAAIERLSVIHREVLALAFGAGLSTAEIAGVLAIPQGTVKSRLRDAKRALRVMLEPGKETL